MSTIKPLTKKPDGDSSKGNENHVKAPTKSKQLLDDSEIIEKDELITPKRYFIMWVYFLSSNIVFLQGFVTNKLQISAPTDLNTVILLYWLLM